MEEVATGLKKTEITIHLQNKYKNQNPEWAGIYGGTGVPPPCLKTTTPQTHCPKVSKRLWSNKWCSTNNYHALFFCLA